MGHMLRRFNGFSKYDDDDDDYDDDDDDDDDETGGIERSGSIGRVLRPSVIEEGKEDDGERCYDDLRSTAALQRLWGEEEKPYGKENEEGNLQHHKERLAGMHRRTGMEFAAQPREFDADGLAKFGGELEEDEDDLFVLRSILTSGKESGNDKPPLDTVAYDSDLDKMSE
jgi:hypothetical protein